MSHCHIEGVTERDTPLMFKYVVPKASRRSPVINRAYYQRTEGIRRIVDGWIEDDPMYFRLAQKRKATQNTTLLKYVDIDYRTLMLERLYMIRTQTALADLLPDDPSVDDAGEFISETYCCLGIDLRDINTLRKGLETAGLFRNGGKRTPVLIISEVALAYLSPEESDEVIQFFSGFSEATFILHEQCIPEFDRDDPEEIQHPFASTMLRHFSRTMTPLKTLAEHRTLEDQLQRFKELGWKHCDISNMNLFSNYVVIPTVEEQQRIRRLEPFDEYDELCWIGAFYFMAIASTEQKISDSVNDTDTPDVLSRLKLRSKFSDHAWLRNSHVDQTSFVSIDYAIKPSSPASTDLTKTVQWSAERPMGGSLVNRKGHTVSILGDNILIYGGFGPDESVPPDSPSIFAARIPHVRLGSIFCYNFEDHTFEMISGNAGDDMLPAPRMHHSAATTLDGSSFYIYGGRDGPTKVHNDVWMYSVEEGWSPQWRGRVSQEGQGTIPEGFYKHTANIMTIAGREMMVVIGGRLASGETNSLIWAFDLQECQWTPLQLRASPYNMGQELPGLFSHSSVVIYSMEGEDEEDGDHLIVIGGIRGDDERIVNSVLKLQFGVSENEDSEMICWYSIKDIIVRPVHPGTSLQPRFGHSCVTVGPGRVWVLGGVSSPGLLQWHETIVEIRIDEGVYENLTPSSFKELVMTGHAATLDSKRQRVIGVGGGGTCFGFGSLWDATPWALKI
ncbi:tRNA methyltransferase ppm2 [Lunasporangiospora selenospora]|uniref:tRNA methyltransferase ppm2 n=1 Tax=Lunasporangiospora selenospora TaxID=979761 RepID=A0A9P6FU58_9FUNG|nr:tRNA methyltransferase ppm2 [Lunasporangiospora selenospora]